MSKDLKSLKKTKQMKASEGVKTDGRYNMNAIVIGDGAMRQDMSACWLEDDSLEGVAPLFEIRCQYHPKEPMMMRYSHLSPKTQRVSKLAGRKIIIEYKCKHCGKVEHFYIDVNEKYLEKIQHRRLIEGYKDLYYPHEKWKNDKIIEEKLKAIGYW